jgi:uncharacterized protein YndB with AHSA1/START domain
MPAEPITAAVHIAAEPAHVFAYLTEPQALVRWMGEFARLDPAPGGEFAVDINGVPVRGRYLELDPPHRLLISWGHAGSSRLPPGASTVEITLTLPAAARTSPSPTATSPSPRRPATSAAGATSSPASRSPPPAATRAPTPSATRPAGRPDQAGGVKARWLPAKRLSLGAVSAARLGDADRRRQRLDLVRRRCAGLPGHRRFRLSRAPNSRERPG